LFPGDGRLVALFDGGVGVHAVFMARKV
jgi:hypothetical protein